MAPEKKSVTISTVSLILFLLGSLAAGGIGAVATAPAIPEWYAGLQKPAWNPPNWVFGPVWTTLYLLMGTAAWLVWRHAGWLRAKTPLSLFIVQLLLNALWSWLFFGVHEIGWALLELIALWLFILATLIAFARHSKLAAGLLIPYLAWVSFAGVLNWTIWTLN